VTASNKEEKYKGLYGWMTTIRQVLRQKAANATDADIDDFYTPERLARLDDLGISPEPNRVRKRQAAENQDDDDDSPKQKKKKRSSKKTSKTRIESDESWDANFAKMKQFVEEHGHSVVPTMSKGPHTLLRNWLEKQRKEYQNLVNSEPSQLTPQRMQKLQSIQFAFETRKKFTWEERFQQWCAYRTTHNGKDPPRFSKCGLGKWISSMRAYHRANQQGEKTPLTQEQTDRLNARGFVWRVQKSPDQIVPKRSWAERFEELKQYKKEHGHTSVPQLQRGLGAWVHKQRTYYSLHLRGIPTDHVNFSAEKIAKLNSIGFAWTARDKAPHNPPATAAAKRSKEDESEDDDEDDEESGDEQQQQQYYHQPHPQYYRWRL